MGYLSSRDQMTMNQRREVGDQAFGRKGEEVKGSMLLHISKYKVQYVKPSTICEGGYDLVSFTQSAECELNIVTISKDTLELLNNFVESK